MYRKVASRTNLITFIFLIQALLFLIKAVLLTKSFVQIDKAVGSFYAPVFYFLEFYWYFLLLPIIFTVAALVFFYCGLKVRDRSPLGWLLGMFFSIVIPSCLWYIGKITVEPTTFYSFGPFWKDTTIAVGVFLFMLLIINTKYFDAEGTPITKRSKEILFLFFLFYCIPAISFFLFVQYRIKTRNYMYPNIQSSVDFYVYQPAYFPDSRVYETNYFIQKRGLVQNNKTVEFQLNYPLTVLMKTRKSGLITVKQSKAMLPLNLRNFIKDINNPATTMKTIMLGKNIKENLIAETKSRKTIAMYTEKNTLIVIEGYYIDERELIKLAESFY